MTRRLLSIVVPVHDEEKNIPVLLDALCVVLTDEDLDFEVVIVDDGSTDRTVEVALAECRERPWLGVVELSRNFGHQAALLAGMRAARGDAVITMDGDLQHPPELIPQLVERWREGFDVVSTRRIEPSEDVAALKTLTSRAFYALLRWNSSIDIEPGMADFRLVDRVALDHLLSTNESVLFFRGLALWIGFRQVTVDYAPGPRHAGSSSYGWYRMLRLARDGMLSFSARPLYWAFAFGLVVAMLSISYGLYAVFVRIVHQSAIPGWASLAVLISFLFGLLFVLLGLMGAYLAAIHTELKGRPRYIVRRYEPSRAPRGRDVGSGGDDQAQSASMELAALKDGR